MPVPVATQSPVGKQRRGLHRKKPGTQSLKGQLGAWLHPRRKGGAPEPTGGQGKGFPRPPLGCRPCSGLVGFLLTHIKSSFYLLSTYCVPGALYTLATGQAQLPPSYRRKKQLAQHIRCELVSEPTWTRLQASASHQRPPVAQPPPPHPLLHPKRVLPKPTRATTTELSKCAPWISPREMKT